MDRQWVVDEVKHVEADRRHLKMQSAQAIRTVQDALVELITNSDDAYQDERGKIIIEVTRRRGETSGSILLKDRAGGMTLDEMKEKILKYGKFSARERSRAFMGRGAKDVVALGNARFESIKNDKVTCVRITKDFDGEIMVPIKASNEYYNEFGVKPGKGGTRVTLDVGKKHKLPLHETLCRDLQRHYALRDILRRQDIRVIDAKDGQTSQLHYTPPKGELVFDESLKFQPPYEGAVARLKIFKAPGPLASELQEGIIVCDERTVHQVTRFSPELDQDPVGRRFFGRLDCKYIRTLQLQFEEFRDHGEESPDHNPVDIVDPNRRLGLDRENHPFIRKLFEWAEDQLRRAVEKVKEEEGYRKGEVASDQTKKRLKDLSKAVAQHLKERLEEETLAPRTQEQEAALNNEGVLLNPYFQRIAVGEKIRMGYTVLSFGEAEDPMQVTIELDGEGLKVTPQKPLLKPQRRNPDRLTAYFEVEGDRPTEKVTLTVRSHELIAPVSRTLEVVEPEEPFAKLSYGLSFAYQKYTVHDNGTRTLVFYAKGRRFRTVKWTARNLVESSHPGSVTILRGKELKVEAVGKEVWKGEVQVRGRGIGSDSRITLSIPTKDGVEVTNTTVEIVEKEQASVSVQIDIVSEPAGQWRASWDRDNPNRIKVYATHPTLDRYLGPKEDNYPGQEHPHFRILLAEIVAEKVVQRILEQRIESNPRLFTEPNTVFFLYSEEMTTFLPIAHKVMIPDPDLKRVVRGYASIPGS